MRKTKQDKTNDDLRINWAQFIPWFNRTLKLYGSVIPELRYLSPGKKSQAQRLVDEAGTKMVLFDAVVHMAKSDFCNGRRRSSKNPNGFIANFPWMLSRDEIIFDLANGKYDNPPEQELTPEEQRQLEQEKYRREQEQRRAEARRIEEEEREAQRRQREYDAAYAAKGEELQRAIAEANKQFAIFKTE